MLILPDYNRPYIIDSLTAPLVVKHHWIFSAPDTDFKLQQITYLEETSGAALKLRINNSEFWVPATWNILITDRETYQLDTVGIQVCSGVKHLAFAFSPDENKLRTLDIMVVDYAENKALVHPMINKGTALVVPVGPIPVMMGKTIQTTVVMGPHDLSKHLTNKVIGEVFSW